MLQPGGQRGLLEVIRGLRGTMVVKKGTIVVIGAEEYCGRQFGGGRVPWWSMGVIGVYWRSVRTGGVHWCPVGIYLVVVCVSCHCSFLLPSSLCWKYAVCWKEITPPIVSSAGHNLNAWEIPGQSHRIKDSWGVYCI